MKKLVLPFALPALLAVLEVRDASACGGCFVPPEESTQVTGHRMLLSVSQQQTTLYDQIEYSGSPESFAWVLPIQGQVDVGLSADGLFSFLGSQTKPYVAPPPQNCPGPPDNCFYGPNASGSGDFEGGGGGGGGSNGGVTIIAQEVVGPYETVQLQASDPLALESWLSTHGYNLPDDIFPVVSAYVDEGFGFLAMKLVPGQSVSAMRPVRVTTQGAGLALPLRMVAAGTGAYTPITLFVVAEGRYQPQNFPVFEIKEEDLLFDASIWESNWDALRASGFEKNGENAWLTESAYPSTRSALQGSLQQVIEFGGSPAGTGYGSADGTGELEEMLADMDVLFAGMSPDMVWYARLYANLPRQSLGQDLVLGASPVQAARPTYYEASGWDGQPPPCPDYSWCYENEQNPGGIALGGGTAICSFGASGSSSALGLAGLAAMAAGLRRRGRKHA